jgi:hypothetical protein
MNHNHVVIKVLVILLIGFTFQGKLLAHGNHPPSCEGPHKKDPECLAPTPPSPAISVNSATIDWLNEKIIVSGENFSGDTTITIAGQSVTAGFVSADQIDIPFDAAIAGTLKGNHNLIANDAPSSSTSSLSLFVKAEIIDKNTAGCPCEADWISELGAGVLWAPMTKTTACSEIAGGATDPVDIAGTVLTNSSDPTVYPHYPIGAAFTAEPDESVCQLTRIDSPFDPTAVTDVVKIRINRLQQGACRTALDTNVCDTITPVAP